MTQDDLATEYETGTDNAELAAATKAVLVGSEGLPIAVQLVAPPWREDLCLRAMREWRRTPTF